MGALMKYLDFPIDVMPIWKFDYYSAGHTWGGGSTHFKCIVLYGENLTSALIPTCNSAYEIATREKPALFVERFQLPFVASLCNLSSPRCGLLEITLSFQNAQNVPTLVSRQLLLLVMAIHKGNQGNEPRP